MCYFKIVNNKGKQIGGFMQYTELIECFRDTMQMACSHTLRKITENAI